MQCYGPSVSSKAMVVVKSPTVTTPAPAGFWKQFLDFFSKLFGRK